MHVVVAGGHGQVARLLTRRLAGAGHQVRGLVRNPAHLDDVAADGGEGVVCDLETGSPAEVTEAVRGVDALVFAAGAGPGSGPGRKETLDFLGALRCIDACRHAGVDRFVMISAMGTDDPPDDSEVFSVYLRAKARADRALMDSALDWTIVRPGRLTDDDPTGRVSLARHVDRGPIPRADVAHVIDEVLQADATIGHVFEVVSGDQEVSAALKELAA